jgi:hypothetical protein
MTLDWRPGILYLFYTIRAKKDDPFLNGSPFAFYLVSPFP